VLEKDH